MGEDWVVGTLRNKWVLALLGVVLVGGTAAALAAMTAAQTRPVTLASSAQTATAADSSQAPTAAPTLSQSPSSSAAATPTRAAVPVAPAVTPTLSFNSGQTIDLHGTVISVNVPASKFVLQQVNGSTTTVVVNSSTQYPGKATSLSTLNAGMVAEVKGVTQTNGTFLAYVVDADVTGN